MIDKAEHQTENQTADASVDSLAVQESPKQSASGRFALFVAMLALFFTAAGIGVGYRHWQRMNDKNTANHEEIAELRKQLGTTANNGEIDNLRKEMADKLGQASAANSDALKEVARMQNQTRQFADTVASQVEQVTFLQARMQQSVAPASTREWQVAEVRFLLQTANRALHLEHNPETAKASLKEADAALTELGAVEYLPVRQQIARDIAALDEAAMPDIAGTSQRITAMMLELKPLPAAQGGESGKKSADAAAPQKDWAGQETSSGNSLWADYKREAMDALSKAVVVRKLDQPLQDELDTDTRQTLFQLLRLRLENLRLLLLQQDNAGFHAQLDLIREAVKTYYPEQQAKPLLDRLQDLQKLDLQPALPDISGSLKQLESARQAENAKSPAAGKGGKHE
jgi:uncharacterized protein HemX